LCAWTLARAHARSGDSVAIAGYLGSSQAFDRAIAAFAEVYDDQNERDHAMLIDAIATGRVRAQAEL
jgi:thiamine monophosphate kinase